MIGQNRFINQVKELIDNGSFPLFSIIVGKAGIGKKTACKEVAKLLKCECIVWSNKIDEIRELKQLMENQTDEIVYCIPDYEDMSIGAKNSILKMCEEPPQKAHIILTSCSKDIIIPTILSRGIVFELDGYTEEELHQIAKDIVTHEHKSINNIIQLCEVPGDIEIAINTDVNEFIEFMNIFCKNISKASAGNLLKVTSKIKLKEDSNGYDLNLFINYLFRIVSNLEVSDKKLKLQYELITARRSIQLKYNKQYILDNLLLNIRGILNGDL